MLQKNCQAKGCTKLGKPKSVARCTYHICDEHNRLLNYIDKLYIARTEGTKH